MSAQAERVEIPAHVLLAQLEEDREARLTRPTPYTTSEGNPFTGRPDAGRINAGLPAPRRSHQRHETAEHRAARLKAMSERRKAELAAERLGAAKDELEDLIHEARGEETS